MKSKSRVLHFLRHGAHDRSEDGRHPGGGLTILGRQQSHCAAAYLKQLPIEVIYSSDHELYVAHGNLIRSLVVLALKVRPQYHWTTFQAYNCSLTTFVVGSKRSVHISTVNNLAYLPLELVSQDSAGDDVFQPAGG